MVSVRIRRHENKLIHETFVPEHKFQVAIFSPQSPPLLLMVARIQGMNSE